MSKSHIQKSFKIKLWTFFLHKPLLRVVFLLVELELTCTDEFYDNNSHCGSEIKFQTEAWTLHLTSRHLLHTSIWRPSLNEPVQCSQLWLQITWHQVLKTLTWHHPLVLKTSLLFLQSVTINNFDKNVNMKCSSVFLVTVASPALCDLARQSSGANSITINNIAIRCTADL